MICHLYSEPFYLLFAPDLPELLYYSHIPASVIALLVGFFVFFNARHELLNKLLLGISICFSLWTFINLITWTNIHSEVILFSWSFVGLLQALISILSVYFVYVFIYKRDVSFNMKLLFTALLAPLLLLSHTPLNLNGLDITVCDAFAYEGTGFLMYYNALGVLAMAWIFGLMVRAYRTVTPEFKKQVLLMGIGIEFFLFTFFIIVFLAGYLTEQGIFEDSRLELYGMFGMIVFMTFIGVLIVRFKAFKVGLIASQALLIALVILIASQYTYTETTTGLTLTSFTLVLTGLVGILLMRSVKKEIEQREEIERLAVNLEKANVRLKELDKMKSEFVSIASHQLRSPLTSIRGYISMLTEGSYGVLPERASEVLAKIAESSKFMALSIEDYLNVSRIEAGNMKYEYSIFDLKEVAQTVIEELRPIAEKRGLSLTYESKATGNTSVRADIGKTRQIIANLLDNSIKYTPKGSITVTVKDAPQAKKIFIVIKDTGVGMSKETLEAVFDKFVRAKNANSVNVTGTGLGLYVAKTMITQMGGHIGAESEGEGKGSTFTIELPLFS